MAEVSRDALLKPDALRGVRIAISVSESPDLRRLGLAETHFRLALAELTRSVLVGGGKLGYGGRLDPSGYTAMLIKELQRYNRRDKPLSVYLAWQEHRKLSGAELQRQIDELGLSGEIICLDVEGRPMQIDRNSAPVLKTDPELGRKALTGLRRYMAEHANGRVVIGGKRSNFEGDMPGVLEEAIESLELQQPLYVVGGFGGISADIAVGMGCLDHNWLPQAFQVADEDDRVSAALARLLKLGSGKGWPDNGLSNSENAQLAATYRPSEIAALVSLGLGRRFGNETARQAQQHIKRKRRVAKRPRKRR